MCAHAFNVYDYIRNSHICIQCICTHLAVISVWLRNSHCVVYEVATSSRLPQNIGLFCKRALQKRRYSAKETYTFDEPTNHSHPIVKCTYAFIAYAFVVGRGRGDIVNTEQDRQYEAVTCFFATYAYETSV